MHFLFASYLLATTIEFEMGAAQSSPTIATTRIESPPAACPMREGSSVPAENPLNRMPTIAQQTRALGQKTVLPLERTISTIPRAVTSGTSPSACPVASSSTDSNAKLAKDKADQWEYPSPQQFYNALVRKGWETPEESIEMMVNIHNWMNEAAWQQVRTWEEKHDGYAIILHRRLYVETNS